MEAGEGRPVGPPFPTAVGGVAGAPSQLRWIHRAAHSCTLHSSWPRAPRLRDTRDRQGTLVRFPGLPAWGPASRAPEFECYSLSLSVCPKS